MIEERKIVKYNPEMAGHANGAAMFLNSLIGGQYVTKEQIQETMSFYLVSTKRIIGSFYNTIRKKKGAQIFSKVFPLNILNSRWHSNTLYCS